MPSSIEITRLRQAIQAFKERPPRDLPDGVLQGLDEVEKQLGETEPIRSTPGASEAQKVGAPTTGTGVHFSKAARGVDVPSPGQKEALSLSEEISAAASSIVGKVKAGESGSRAKAGDSPS